MRIELTTSSLPRKCSTPELQRPLVKPGAADEIRTRDIQLGRLTLYQLSYHRFNRRSFSEGGVLYKCFSTPYSSDRSERKQDEEKLPAFTKATAGEVGVVGFEPTQR